MPAAPKTLSNRSAVNVGLGAEERDVPLSVGAAAKGHHEVVGFDIAGSVTDIANSKWAISALWAHFSPNRIKHLAVGVAEVDGDYFQVR